MKTATLAQARAAKTKTEAIVAALPVVGIGITRVDDGYAVKVNLSVHVPAGAIPSHVDGVPIATEVVGAIKKR